LIVKETSQVVKDQLKEFSSSNWSKIVDMLRKLFFNLAYYQKPIWDTGISPPELLDFIAAHPPGKALELGCGTGTNTIALAKHGWQVTGVDFAHKALQTARQKAQQNGIQIDLRLQDVTRLNSIRGPFDLILDIGCFHSLSSSYRSRYIKNLTVLLSPNGTYLLYVFFKNSDQNLGPGITEADMKTLERALKLIDRRDGDERGFRPSAWLTFQPAG
jgi:2-polyprenyl-3-methyl-5-hydroxy-6-metoxy-1,4-benzoquinol methylase